jgi:hypothetical protein
VDRGAPLLPTAEPGLGLRRGQRASAPFGNRANLGSDQRDTRSRDDSNPYLSAVLRGFFAYLFMTSGLLLLMMRPFSHPSPGQYIRLAGFLSLLCFVVSYQPRLFNTLIVWAFHRIEVREGKGSGTRRN